MTFHTSSPAFQALAEQIDAYAREILGIDYATLEIHREDRRMVDESDVLNPDETVIWGYGGDHRAVASFGRND